MTLHVYPGNKVKFRAQFDDEQTSAVDVKVEDLSDDSYEVASADQEDDEGYTFTYGWEADELGDFKITFEGEDQDIEHYVTVKLPMYEPESSALGQDVEIHFAGESDKVLADPEEIVAIFPDARHADVLDAVYKASQAAITEIGSKKDIEKEIEENPRIIDYVKAKTLCELSRVYDPIMGGEEHSLRLGDLNISVQHPTGAKLSSATASNWCELAYALYFEVFGAWNRHFVKGRRIPSNLPPRQLQRGYQAKWRRDFEDWRRGRL